MLFILKIPVIYLGVVVWWAIKDEPRPQEGVSISASLDSTPPCDWPGRAHRRLSRPRPFHGGPAPARRGSLQRAGVRP